MRVILEFNIPENQNEFDIYQKAMSMYSFISEIKDNIKHRIKYTESDNISLTELNELIHSKLQENDIEGLF